MRQKFDDDESRSRKGREKTRSNRGADRGREAALTLETAPALADVIALASVTGVATGGLDRVHLRVAAAGPAMTAAVVEIESGAIAVRLHVVDVMVGLLLGSTCANVEKTTIAAKSHRRRLKNPKRPATTTIFLQATPLRK